jgi:hypothetical protein
MSDNGNPDLDDDDVLMSLLGETLAETEPLSDELVATVATAAFELRRLDAVLADMIFDSALSAGGTRGDDTSRNIVFSKNGVEVELEIDADGETVHGLVQPTDTACEIESPAGVRPIEVDDAGRFDLTIDARQFRLLLTPPSGSRIATPWVFR